MRLRALALLHTLVHLAAADSNGGVRLTAASASCNSITLRWPAAVGSALSVLEYGVWWKSLGGGADDDASMRQYAADGLIETTLEVGSLQPGARYAFEVRARTAQGWHSYTDSLRESTMAPSDFPLPILAPEVRGFAGCSTIRLSLPTLRFCHATTHIALQYRRGGPAGTWQMMRERVLGGDIEVGGLQPDAAHEFRLVGFEQASEARPAAGASTPPVLTDFLSSRLLAAPRAKATSSASFELSWDEDSHCRPGARWRLAYRKLADAAGEHATDGDGSRRALLEAAPPARAPPNLFFSAPPPSPHASSPPPVVAAPTVVPSRRQLAPLATSLPPLAHDVVDNSARENASATAVQAQMKGRNARKQGEQMKHGNRPVAPDAGVAATPTASRRQLAPPTCARGFTAAGGGCFAALKGAASTAREASRACAALSAGTDRTTD